jgi:hypothetical protein
MNAVTPWVIALLTGTAVVGLAWAWWAHRQRLAEMQRRLAWNEQSRFELERHTQALDERLATMAQTLKTLESERRPAPQPVPAWPDTEPLLKPPVPARAAVTSPNACNASSLPNSAFGAASGRAAGIHEASAQAFAATLPVGLDDLEHLPSAPPAQERVLPLRR